MQINWYDILFCITRNILTNILTFLFELNFIKYNFKYKYRMEINNQLKCCWWVYSFWELRRLCRHFRRHSSLENNIINIYMTFIKIYENTSPLLHTKASQPYTPSYNFNMMFFFKIRFNFLSVTLSHWLLSTVLILNIF